MPNNKKTEKIRFILTRYKPYYIEIQVVLIWSKA